jgi:hypothetical protein
LQFEFFFFSLLIFFGRSFGFAFERWFLKLEKALLKHFKLLKIEKNWERFAKVFGDKLMFNDGPILAPIFICEGICMQKV